MLRSNLLRLTSILFVVPLLYMGSTQYYSQHCGFISDPDRRQLINSLDKELISMLQTNRSVALDDACQMPPQKLQRAIEKAIGPKPDHPGEAAKFRYEQQLSENKKFDTENWHKSRAQVREQLKFQRRDAGINSTVWEELGPGNIGGRVRSLAFDPSDADRIYAGSVSGGIWLTENAGTSWAPVDDFMANLSISSIIFDPTNNNIMYAGTGEGTFNADNVRGLGIFKSTDKGATWNILTSTKDSFDFYWVNRLTILNDASRLIAATHTGIWRSEDGGTNWSSALSARVFDVDVDPTDSAKLVAGGQGNAYYSTDSGLTWTAASGLGSVSGRIEIAYAASDPTIVYVSANASSGQIWKSSDSGQSYSLVNTGNSYLGSQGWYDNALWVDPTDADHVIVGGIDLWRTTDGGASLNKISTWWKAPNSAHADHHFIQEHPGYDGVNNKQVYFGNDGGVYTAPDITVANDDTGWTELNNSLSITQFYGMGVGPNGRIVAGTQDNGTLVYNGDSENWTTTFGGDGGYSAADPNDENYLYGEYVYLNIHRSTNGGISSSYIYDNAMTSGANFIAPFILDPNDENRLLGGAAELWVTDNAKAADPSWSSKKPAISGNESISAIAVESGNSDVIYIGHDDGSVYKTSNGTAATPNWTEISGTLPSRRVLRLAVAPLNNQVVYATFSGYNSNNLWKSTDGGATWNVSVGTNPSNIPPAPIRTIVIHPTQNDLLYVGTEVGVFTSEDAGATWSLENDGPANVSVDELVWHGTSTLYAATHGRGIFKATVNDITPDGLVFNDVLDAPLSTEITTPEQTLSGISGAVDFSIINGEYSIGCNGTFTSNTTSINNGDTFCVRHTSSADYWTVTTTNFSIGAGNYTFASRTLADTSPDSFSFNALTDVNLSETQTSNSVTVSGITNQVDISVTNGEYSIGCTNSFTTTSGTISLNDSVCVRHSSSAQNLETVTTTLNIGDTSADFTSTTLPDTTPDSFNFNDVSEVEINSLQTSNSISVTGIQVAIPISVAGGEYSIGCAANAFTAAAGTISENQTVCVRHTASSDYFTQTTTTLNLNGVTADFSSTTTQDGTPDGLVFNDVLDAPLSTEITTPEQTLSGISGAVDFSIINGEYSIGCNGTFTSNTTSINNGDTFCVRHTSSADYWTVTTTNFSIGAGNYTFASRTLADTSPDSFSFNALTDVNLSETQTSNSVTVSGITNQVDISVTNGEYSIGCTNSFTATSGNISLNDSVCVRHSSSAQNLETVTTTLNIGDVSANFASTTLPDTTPDSFNFNDVSEVEINSLQTSNSISVTGIQVAIPISVTGGEYSIGCAANAFTTAAGTISQNQTVCVRHTASSDYLTQTTTTLNLNGVTADFSSTTIPDRTPDGFAFTSQTLVAISSLVTSNSVTITGISNQVDISVVNGEYSIGCNGTFTSVSGSVSLNDNVCVRHTSSSLHLEEVTTSLTVGTLSESFTSTTVPDTTPDNFSFVQVTEVALNSIQVSDTILVTGIQIEVPIAVSGGEYSIGCDSGSFVSTAGTVSPGETVCVRHTASADYLTQTTTILDVNGVSADFTSTTVSDTTPDSFSFGEQTSVELATLITSNTVTITGITNQASISITNGEYSIGCTSNFTDVSGTILLNESVCIRHTSSDQHLGTVTSSLTIGDTVENFSSTTIPDTTPDSFSFTEVTEADLNSIQTSNTITVAGIQVEVPISVTSGEYSIGCDTNSFVTGAGTISPGETVCVRHTAASDYASQTTTILDINGVTAEFNSTTIPDRTPDSFNFNSVSSVGRSSQVVSNTITISGIGVEVDISVSNGEFSIGCDESFTNTAASIRNGERVCVRHTSSSDYSTSTQTTLIVGTESATFTSTTEAEPIDPPSDSSGGGSFGYLLLVLLGLTISSKRKR